MQVKKLIYNKALFIPNKMMEGGQVLFFLYSGLVFGVDRRVFNDCLSPLTFNATSKVVLHEN